MKPMNGRERVRAALNFRPVDKAPLQFYYAPVGYHEHGERLNELYSTLPGDFGPFVRVPAPVIPPSDFDPDGSYHAFRRDEWGTLWEHRIFGVWGLPREHPLADMERLADYRFPEPPLEDLSAARSRADAHKLHHFLMMGGGSIFERLKMLRPDEDVLCDIQTDAPGIHLLADRICAYNARLIERAIAAGADAISVADDYGSERGMLISPSAWRRFFKPRWTELLRPAVDAGLHVVFHCCGQVSPILPDIREMGASAIWPQLPAYDMAGLARVCRELHLAVAIHTDRANTMTHGTPAQVRDLVKREHDVFRVPEGGSWFYVEADNGFPFENIEALIRAIAEYR